MPYAKPEGEHIYQVQDNVYVDLYMHKPYTVK